MRTHPAIIAAVVAAGCPGPAAVDRRPEAADVADDPAAPAAMAHVLRVGGSGNDRMRGATFLPDGTVIVSAAVAATGDVRAGALPVDGISGGVVAGFDADGRAVFAVSADA